MCREAQDSILRENITPVDIVRAIDCLSHELSCLFDLGALTTEENDALVTFLEDLRTLLARARKTGVPAAMDRHELFWMVRLLAADLDRAYQRLYTAA